MAKQPLIDPYNLPSNNKDTPNLPLGPIASGVEKPRKRNFSYEVRGIVNDIFTNVIIPGSKGLLYEFLKDSWNRITGQLIYGKDIQQNAHQARGLRGSGYYSYDNMYSPRRPTRLEGYRGGELALSPVTNPIVMDIFYPNERKARLVLAGMLDYIDHYGKVSLGDYRFLSNLDSGKVHQQYGWTDLTGTEPVPTPDGWMLTLPDFQYTTIRR